MSTGKSTAPRKHDILIGALLRVPAQAVHRRILTGLNSAGFDDLRLPHIAVFLYPGPDGCRPSDLADRAGISKQAMNQLLGSLETLGYLTRASSSARGRTRLVHFTKRGHKAFAKIYDILLTVEAEWREQLGPANFKTLKRLLLKLWQTPTIH